MSAEARSVIELKPCPFCGGKAYENFIAADEFRYCIQLRYSILCWDCGAESDHYESADVARAAWNQRATLTCEGCVNNDKDYNGDWCGMCSRCHPDLYEPADEVE